MTAGLHVVIVILSIYGLLYLKELVRNNKTVKQYILENNTFLVLLFILFFCLTNYYILVMELDYSFQAYLSKEKFRAMQWLQENSPEESIVLSSSRSGNIIPVFSLRSVYAGHGIMTAQMKEKLKNIDWFFGSRADDELKKNFLKEAGIDYLFYSSEEKNLGLFRPQEKDYLKEVYRNNEVLVFQIVNL